MLPWFCLGYTFALVLNVFTCQVLFGDYFPYKFEML